MSIAGECTHNATRGCKTINCWNGSETTNFGWEKRHSSRLHSYLPWPQHGVRKQSSRWITRYGCVVVWGLFVYSWWDKVMLVYSLFCFFFCLSYVENDGQLSSAKGTLTVYGQRMAALWLKLRPQSTGKRNYVTAFCFSFVLVRTKSIKRAKETGKLPFKRFSLKYLSALII